MGRDRGTMTGASTGPTLSQVSQTAGRRLPFQTLRAQAAAQPLRRGHAAGAGAECPVDLHAGSPAPRTLARSTRSNLTLLLLQTLPLAVRRRWPVAVFLITFGALMVQVLVIQNAFSAPLGSFIALYTVGQRVDRTRSGLLAAGAALVFLLVMIEKGALPAGIAGVIQSELALLVVWTLGVWSRERQAYVGEVEERAARLEREREERDARAVARRARADRARAPRRGHPPRERHRHPGGGGAARPRPAAGGGADGASRPSIRPRARRWPTCAGCSASWPRRRQSRAWSVPATRRPIPSRRCPASTGWASCSRQVRATGLPVELTVEGERRPLDPGIELSAYRIIQEALTNALKHARGATAQVRVRYTVAAPGDRGRRSRRIRRPRHRRPGRAVGAA